MVIPEAYTALILGTPSLAWAVYGGFKTVEDIRRRHLWMATLGVICTLAAVVFLVWTLWDLTLALTARPYYARDWGG